MIIVYLMGGVVFFGLCLAFVSLAERLREGGS